MKLTQMSAAQISEVARANKIKPSLLKIAVGENADIETVEGVSTIEGVALRDHISEMHGEGLLDDVTTGELDELNDLSQNRYAHTLEAPGIAFPDPIGDAANRRYAHVLEKK